MCISILHTPGDDPTQYEQASERWSPVQSVEKVILSVVSMLAGMATYLRTSADAADLPISHAEPNLESGANIDCCKLYRDNREVGCGIATSRAQLTGLMTSFLTGICSDREGVYT